MDTIIMELLMPQLADRMSIAYSESEDYSKCFHTEEQLYKQLQNNLHGELCDTLEEYFLATIETKAAAEKISYIQGMKDLLAFLKALS